MMRGTLSRLGLLSAIFLACCAPMRVAQADLDAQVRAHEDAFARACQSGDMPGTLALYADDARVVWPGVGEEARGKGEIEKLLIRGCSALKDHKLVLQSVDAIQLDGSHVATVGQWEDTFTGPHGKPMTSIVRTTEVLVKHEGRWKYLLDHASVGLPPPEPAHHPKARRPARRHR